MSSNCESGLVDDHEGTNQEVDPRSEAVGGFALIDTDRLARTGLPEAIYTPSKTTTQVLEICDHQLKGDAPVLATRCSFDLAVALSKGFDSISVHPDLKEPSPYYTCVARSAPSRGHRVGVVTGGTSDLAVAHEARATLMALGIDCEIICDVGVAGIHRLFDAIDMIRSFDALVVVAGMEASLASVIGGLVATPIVAVPTSTGYGSSLQGITATLSMLASCAPGISIVGIDNGFGAACSISKLFDLVDAKISAAGGSIADGPLPGGG